MYLLDAIMSLTFNMVGLYWIIWIRLEHLFVGSLYLVFRSLIFFPIFISFWKQISKQGLLHFIVYYPEKVYFKEMLQSQVQ